MSTRWAIITGEYPPKPGGVSDYTRQIAELLADCSDEVHVIAPPGASGESTRQEIAVHVIPDIFGRRGRMAASSIIRQIRPDRVLLQYVPHGFGMKAMNVPFVRWLTALPYPLDVMFHEVRYPRIPGQPWRHILLARVTDWMARKIARRADRIFVSTLHWTAMLESMVGRVTPPIWTPVPTNVTTIVSPLRVAEIRDRLKLEGRLLVGHFGSYGELMIGVMENALLRLLDRDAAISVLMIGRNSDGYTADLVRRHPSLIGRLSATGAMSGDEVSAHLAACDLLLQPFSDGMSARRTSAMAGLALGVPVVSCRGASTEAVWLDGNAIALAEDSEPDRLADITLQLLQDEPRRKSLGEGGRALYYRLFDVSHTVDALRRLETGPLKV